MAEAATQTRYRVEGMDCAACAAKIDTAVRRLPWIADVSVSATAGTMTVQHDGLGDLGQLELVVTRLGYGIAQANRVARPQGNAHVHDHGHDHAHHDHANCDHAHHDHAHHDHSGHDHSGHDHAGHDHAGHDHAGHDHAGQAHGATAHGHDHAPPARVWWRTPKARLTAAAGAAVLAAYGVGLAVPTIGPFAFLAAMLVGLVPIARRAVMAARAGTPFSIEMLMTIAAVGAVIINAGEEAAAVVFLFLVGELLEGVAAGRARASIEGLAALVPKTALVERDGQSVEMPADSVRVGAVILVRPGDRIAADGVIVAGESGIDEAPVTGESVPRRKGVDDVVFAGTINGDAALRIRVTAAASDYTIARVVRLVEEAQESKAPTERFIDRFSRLYTPCVVAVAALVAIVPPLLFGGAWGAWVYKGLAILLIGCPCALVISTPAAIAASLSAGARRGLLLKGGAVLENLGRITAVAFDKTGTLTEGKPSVTDVIGFDRPESEVLRLAAALEAGSSHPLAAAILAHAKAERVTPPPTEGGAAIGGEGVSGRVEGATVFLGSATAAGARATLGAEAQARIAALHAAGKSVAVLVVDGAAAGVIAMRDRVRDDARAGVRALADAGIACVMLTGDNARTAASVGEALGIEVRAGLMPADKQRIVTEMRAKGLVVAKVGDGINDAPALAAADVGIAMGGGTDVALETADAAVLHGRVGDVAAMVALSKRTMGNIHQNIAIALGLKAVFLVTTIAGITGLWPAIMADTGATVLVTLNALRLLRVKAA